MAFAICAVDSTFCYSLIRMQGRFVVLRNTTSVFGNIGNPVDCLEFRNS